MSAQGIMFAVIDVTGNTDPPKNLFKGLNSVLIGLRLLDVITSGTRWKMVAGFVSKWYPKTSCGKPLFKHFLGCSRECFLSILHKPQSLDTVPSLKFDSL